MTPSRPRITLRDIAKETGVSHVSVSLALRGNPRISAKKRELILKTAERLGYRPDPMLSALSVYRHARKKQSIRACIGWLNFWPGHAQARHFGEFDEYKRGAKETVEKLGYHLEEFCPGPKLSMKRLEGMLLARGIQGLLMAPPPTVGLIDEQSMDWSHFSVVCFGHSYPRLPMHLVTADQAEAGKLAFRSIVERGYRRVGLAIEDWAVINTLFAAGFLQEQVAQPAAYSIPMLKLEHLKKDAQPQKLQSYIRKVKPDVIFTNLPSLPSMLEELGIRVPQDIALATTSVMDGNVNAGIYQHPDEIGRVAAETVISLINNNHKGIPELQRQILVEGSWVDGSMLPPKPRATQP